ncbi:sugar phosphate nucleotidyltransferase, partial [Arthrobacter sp. SDTb3-6]|uniref:sugar phosphate nucleotidyltransferase n=2 Tax=unclassified Arthrobacter TaxID=235627 RepID=UPI001821838C
MNTNAFRGAAAPGYSPVDKFVAVIPAGGVGTRLWPLSRAAAPKFLHDLTGS